MLSWFSRALNFFLGPYQGSPYSDRARLRVFVLIQLVLLLLVVGLAVGSGWGAPVTLPILSANLFYLVGLLFLVRLGHRNWAEGINALLLPVFFLLAVINDPKVLPNPLADDLLLVYNLFLLILVTLTTSKARWIVATGVIFLVGSFWLRFWVQIPYLSPESLAEVVPPPAARFVVFSVLAVVCLVTIQRIIQRANALADAAQTRLEEANRELEETVESQGRDLQDALDQVRSAQRSLAEGDKLSTVGRFVAGIAHEINTPLAAIDSSASTIRDLMGAIAGVLLDDQAAWSPLEKQLLREILAKTDKLGLGTSNLEKRTLRKNLASLKTSDGNPLSPELVDHLGEWGLSLPQIEWLDFLSSERGNRAVNLLGRVVELSRSASIISMASEKASVYVSELRKFITKDRSSRPEEAVSVTRSLETFLLLYQNQLRGKIEVVRRYPENEPFVLGFPDRLLQIWSNLISNAVGAMGEKGTLTLEVLAGVQTVEICVGDDGPGIAEGLQQRIFEPFFSTKQMGEGMGLGLEIVRSIVEEHHGKVHFESRPGKTVFTVTLPRWEKR